MCVASHLSLIKNQMDPNALNKMRRKVNPLNKQQSTPNLGKEEYTISIIYEISYRQKSTQRSPTCK